MYSRYFYYSSSCLHTAFLQYLYLTLLHVICFLTCYDLLRCTVLAPVLTGPVDKFYR
ncbi:hypothetical protein M6B38_383420 [Iris pallida]|uniref:Uncharacterized protein n=1 Tax=Iris pallida TaxID=29817 RepID=A0AAX6G568_IRIPA|nr:hypothetical protein M6B38_188585 [Iris pallida]KAJ6823505.1 hypothetical protein M6B38_383420 [Iris pallida]